MRKPFKAEMMVGTKVTNLGFFSTAEEAALCCARQRAAVPGGSERRAKSKAKPKVAPGSTPDSLTVGELPQVRASSAYSTYRCPHVFQVRVHGWFGGALLEKASVIISIPSFVYAHLFTQRDTDRERERCSDTTRIITE